MAVVDFAGEFYCTLDAKNRVNIPSGVRKMFVPEAQNTLVFTRGFEMENLYAYPLNEWKRLTNKLRTLNPFEKKTRDFIRLFVGGAHVATMDGQGRIMIPERILKIGKIEKEMLLLGSLNKIEIWNPRVYEEYLQKEKLNLTDLAEEISFADMFFEKGE
ncbi:MAG TPA: division/cell wall cluster transcriptional repressor MraZ [Caldithrix abyssi]|uniref:Transcriptional regulator MraZ n=1 Tax=Caldithrix abyssi TaxID=187145 RepID=A0A7V5PNP7_CALAY|nr:division/cell wall cluster transcriptional repressor MraZ [Caldithrix abyssi]